MPLIDEQSRATDRRPTAWWAWALIVAVLAALWMVGALALSLSTREGVRTSGHLPAAVAENYDRLLNQAQQMGGYGQWEQSAALIASMGEAPPLTTMQKHTYFRVAGDAYRKTGSPLKAAGYTERFVAMGAQINEEECKNCHAPPGSIAPINLVGATRLDLGVTYATALKRAGKLDSTLRRRRKELKADPDSARLHLLLYYLERAAGNGQAAEAHVRKLSEVDARS
jgi:hypothetical protein